MFARVLLNSLTLWTGRRPGPLDPPSGSPGPAWREVRSVSELPPGRASGMWRVPGCRCWPATGSASARSVRWHPEPSSWRSLRRFLFAARQGLLDAAWMQPDAEALFDQRHQRGAGGATVQGKVVVDEPQDRGGDLVRAAPLREQALQAVLGEGLGDPRDGRRGRQNSKLSAYFSSDYINR